ncbi:hypothetical protein H4R18_005625 [Coemansia javaensis]|uniref:Uncharacterized protein n=1 Tax=Coemansia javaensis TaxID=2761396 RepID=A0A9W8H2L3_9FUNG|nr:hypothetical protein H4R18_005625 [Coemansia javaensis]
MLTRLSGAAAAAAAARRGSAAAGRRLESTIRVGTETGVAGRPAASEPRKRRAIGGFRGGVLGFLLGVTTAGAFGFVYLIEEYHRATGLVLSSVEELERSSLKVKEYVKKIEAVEADVGRLRSNSATAQQLAQAKGDWRKQNDILARDLLELKAHVWQVEQDVDTALGRAAKAKAGRSNNKAKEAKD